MALKYEISDVKTSVDYSLRPAVGSMYSTDQARNLVSPNPSYLPNFPEDLPSYEEEEKKRIAKRQQELIQERRIARIKKQSLINRRKKIALWVVCIGLVSIIFGGLMVRQANIYEQNFANTALRRKIQVQKEENTDLQNRLVSKSDSAYIEKEALRLFGLRRPSQMQRVVVELPTSDSLVFYERLQYKSKDGQSVSNNYQVLEAYMKAFSLHND